MFYGETFPPRTWGGDFKKTRLQKFENERNFPEPPEEFYVDWLDVEISKTKSIEPILITWPLKLLTNPYDYVG